MKKESSLIDSKVKASEASKYQSQTPIKWKNNDDESILSTPSEMSFTLSKSKRMDPYNYPGEDTLDHSVIKFNENYALRGRKGLYLTALPTSSPNTLKDPESSSSSKVGNKSTYFLLGGNGQGIGEKFECLNFVNLEQREMKGPIKYGTTVAIKAPAAKERILGIRDGSKLGFWRNLVGLGEKWMILKAADPVGIDVTSVTGESVPYNTEEMGSRGKYARIGDTILIQTAKSEQVLSLQDEHQNDSVVLQYRDRCVLRLESWQLEQFGSVPIPDWLRKRHYLNGEYSFIPRTMRATQLM